MHITVNNCDKMSVNIYNSICYYNYSFLMRRPMYHLILEKMARGLPSDIPIFNRFLDIFTISKIFEVCSLIFNTAPFAHFRLAKSGSCVEESRRMVLSYTIHIDNWFITYSESKTLWPVTYNFWKLERVRLLKCDTLFIIKWI